MYKSLIQRGKKNNTTGPAEKDRKDARSKGGGEFKFCKQRKYFYLQLFTIVVGREEGISALFSPPQNRDKTELFSLTKKKSAIIEPCSRVLSPKKGDG